MTEYLLKTDIDHLSQEVRDNFWFYVDTALGYEFWADKQEEINKLRSNCEGMDTSR